MQETFCYSLSTSNTNTVTPEAVYEQVLIDAWEMGGGGI
jgi:hypothetical protein